MNLFNLLTRRTSAPVARERLQILLAHERVTTSGPSELVALLREEIMAVVAKHISVEADHVRVKMGRGDSLSTLEVEVDFPTAAKVKPAA